MSRHTIYATLSWAETLYQMLHGFHVDGGPGQPGPAISRDAAQLAAGRIVREMSAHIQDPRLADSVRQLGRDLFQRGAAGLAGSYDGGGPPWIDPPFPFPWPPKKFDRGDSVFNALQAGALDHVLSALAHRLADVSSGTPVHAGVAGA